MIQNTVDVIYITTLHIKNEKVMWKRNSYLFIGVMNDSRIDNEEVAIWLLYGSLV